MRLEIKDNAKSELFVTCFQYFKNFTDSINIMFEENRMYVQCMDNGMVIVLELSLPNDWFDMYELTSEQSVTIGINTHTWSKVLAMKEKNQTIKINTDDKDDKLLVAFCSETKNEGEKSVPFNKEFEIPLMDIESELMEIPPTEYEADIIMQSTMFSSMVNQLKQFGEFVQINCDENNVNFSSYSDVCGKMDANIDVSNLEEYAIDENAILKMSYSLKYFYNISQFQKISKNIQLHLKDNFPIMLKYEIDGNGVLQFYIAPKIEDDI
jgi:proliferating cell nuclear antigen PCNA